MNTEEIELFLDKKLSPASKYVKITFKKRDSIYGLFIRDRDFDYLKGKNFWRIVPRSRFEEFQKSKNVSLARIFNGAEFTRLTPYSESFD